jgi:NAD(P)-dependent dehydrogenase (short-subunit alcohol dehydrogenase family)
MLLHGFPAVEPGSRVCPDVERGGTQQGQKRQFLDFTSGRLRDDMRFLIRARGLAPGHGCQFYGALFRNQDGHPGYAPGWGGSIINISSQLGIVAGRSASPQYHASKGAVRLLSKATAIQYATEGIRVNSLHPGPIETQMTAEVRAVPDRLRRLEGMIPLGRLGRAEEVAYGVLYLASDESAFVTGSELVIDGGWTAQ